MPISAMTTFLGSIVMLTSWFIIGRRMKADPQAVTVQVRYLHNFFLFMGIFCLIMAIPTLAIVFSPENFPALMAWGYTIGHIFTYVAFTYILRLTFSLVPRLANKDWLAIAVGGFATVFITIATFLTMALGTHPNFNPTDNLIMYNAAPVVGVSIAVFATLAVLPTTILMLVNGFRSPGSRVRSFLLGGGLSLTMVSGPMHDVARTSVVYAAADILSIIGQIIIAYGMLYHFSERTAWVKGTGDQPAGSNPAHTTGI